MRHAKTIWSVVAFIPLEVHSNFLELQVQDLCLQDTKAALQENAHRLEYVDKAGLYLMQKSEPPECVRTQDDLDAFHALLNAVLAKLIASGEKAASMAKGRVRDSGFVALRTFPPPPSTQDA